jgi:hypothetical protein
MSKLKTLSQVVYDKEYNCEENNVIIIEKLNRFSVIPSNMKMYYYGKLMEGTEKRLNEDTTRFSIIKETKRKLFYLS